MHCFLAKEATEPIQVSVKAGGTVSELIRAQEKLIGPMQVEKVFAQDGGEVSLSHALLPGQVLCIQYVCSHTWICDDGSVASFDLGDHWTCPV